MPGATPPRTRLTAEANTAVGAGSWTPLRRRDERAGTLGVDAAAHSALTTSPRASSELLRCPPRMAAHTEGRGERRPFRPGSSSRHHRSVGRHRQQTSTARMGGWPQAGWMWPPGTAGTLSAFGMAGSLGPMNGQRSSAPGGLAGDLPASALLPSTRETAQILVLCFTSRFLGTHASFVTPTTRKGAWGRMRELSSTGREIPDQGLLAQSRLITPRRLRRAAASTAPAFRVRPPDKPSSRRRGPACASGCPH